MGYADFAALSPLIIISATAVLLMLSIAIRRSHRTAVVISLLGLGLALGSLTFASSVAPRQVTAFLILDRYSFLYMGILISAAAFVFLFGYDYLNRRREHQEEFYLLTLLATTGAMVLVASRNFASLFLGLELLSVSLYALIGYVRTERVSIEAGIKYLVLAASSSSILLFGLALIYSKSGSMNLSQFTAMTHSYGQADSIFPRGPHALSLRHRFQVGNRSISSLDPGCLRRRASAGHRVHRYSIEGRNVRLALALVPNSGCRAGRSDGPRPLDHGDRFHVDRQSSRPATDQR